MSTLLKNNPASNLKSTNAKQDSTFAPPASLSVRDRLLNALLPAPLIKPEDAEVIEKAIREAREESILREISA